MSLVLDSLIIILLFALFGVSHSILASIWFKNLLISSIGNKIAFYRLFYNISSVIIFVFLYSIAPKPELQIYDLEFPFDMIILGFQILSLIGLLWSGSYIDMKEFIGIRQIQRYFNDQYDINELDEHQTLIQKGPFKYSRHPIYFFSILFLGLRPSMDLAYLILFFSLTVYFIAGSYYEEKKMVERFGDSYIEYQKKVPRILPLKFLKNRS